MIKEFIDIILEDPKAAIIDFITILGVFGGWLATYIILTCLIP